jgi:hypothetical protein
MILSQHYNKTAIGGSLENLASVENLLDFLQLVSFSLADDNI